MLCVMYVSGQHLANQYPGSHLNIESFGVLLYFTHYNVKLNDI